MDRGKEFELWLSGINMIDMMKKFGVQKTLRKIPNRKGENGQNIFHLFGLLD